MAEGDKVTEKLVPASVEHKTWPKKDRETGELTGETGELWNVVFVGGLYPSSTFSKTCADALQTKLGTELLFRLTGAKPFRDKDQWNIDQVSDPTTGEVVYEPEAKKGGGYKGGGKGGGYSRPDWTYEDQAERLETRLSIEAQKALDLAVQTLAAIVVYDDDVSKGDGAIAFVSSAQKAYATLLRESVDQKSGSGSRHSGAGGRRSSTGSKGSSGEGQPSESSSAPPNEPSRPGDGLPTPEPGSSSSETLADIEKLLVGIDALTGNRSKTLLAYKRILEKTPDVSAMSSQELAIVRSSLEAAEVSA